MSLKNKLALPSPKWLLFGLVIVVAIGVAKLLMWLTPLLVAGIVKLVLWVAPLAWQACIYAAAALCAVVVLMWRRRQQRQLHKVVASGNVIELYHRL